ncbi:MAG: response regulator [Desulfobacterales bacterium]|nr:response regulator [Desulfobacterales bacterium]
MDKVLIVDGDQDNLNKLKAGLNNLHQFKVLTASDGQEAIDLLQRERISVFVTDINTPKVDGLELLAYMTQNHPATPCIIMSEYGKPWFKKRKGQEELLYHIEKPTDLGVLTSSIFVGLNLKDEGANFKGMSLSTFLPLIELECRTCRLEVKSNTKGKGYLYFKEGILIDAHYNDLNGEEAALKMADWEDIELKFAELPIRRINKRRVKTDLMDIVQATWLQDETIIEEQEKIDSEITDKNVSLFDEKEKVDLLKNTNKIDYKPLRKEAIEPILTACIKELRAIKGYLSVGIMNCDGAVLAHDSIDETIDLNRLGSAFNTIFKLSDETSAKQGLDQCRELTIHTPQRIILILGPERSAQINFQIIGVMSQDGNWFFMKFLLEKIVSKLIQTA